MITSTLKFPKRPDTSPRECLKIIESKSKVRQSQSKEVIAKVSTSSSTPAVSSDVAELKDMVRALILDKKNQTPIPAPVKAVEQSCVTAGVVISYRKGQVYQPQINQPPTFQAPPYQAPAPAPPAPGVSKSDFDNYVKANTEMENEPEVTKDMVQPSTENIQPPVVQTNDQIGEPVVASKTKPTLPYPSRANTEKLLKKNDLLASKLWSFFPNLHFELSLRRNALLHNAQICTNV
ncbi:hypothetical protein Tco_0629717 [Tanacetum coccineum]|uniref:Uncharacterized protein n=1 Tax=Tanacetum coccineum TaxID=301880 RepID=A0ABQ4WU67_9ASTR